MIEITRHVRSVMYRERGRRHGFLAVFVAAWTQGSHSLGRRLG